MTVVSQSNVSAMMENDYKAIRSSLSYVNLMGKCRVAFAVKIQQLKWAEIQFSRIPALLGELIFRV